MTKHRQPFTPRNNLDLKKGPIFRPQTPPSPTDQQNFQARTDFSSASGFSLHLPHIQRGSDPLASIIELSGETLSELGDSSSLFSLKTPPEFNSTSTCPQYPRGNSPIPSVLGTLNQHQQLLKEGRQQSKMVNERSPAKAPLLPVAPNEQPHPQTQAESAVLSKPTQVTGPQFGQTSALQSPLQRPPQKESNVFIQPKSRPEHHRDFNKLSTVPFFHYLN